MNHWGYYKDLVSALVAKDLKVRYRSTFLGYVWSVLHPLMFAFVFFIVFRVIVRIDVPNYALFLVAGLFPWQWIQNSTSASATCFIANASLVKKVSFPRWLLVTASTLNDLVHFLLTIPVIVVFLLWHSEAPSLNWLYQVPLMTLATFLLTQGLALFVATCNLFFRDLERIVVLLLMLWFYMTPILYPPEFVPEEWRWLHMVNPMAPIIMGWRGVFLEGALPPLILLASFAWAAAFALLGQSVYRVLQWRFAELV